MAINEWYWYFSASRNPYDVTERMQWEWRQASFDWTNGMVLWVHEQVTLMLEARLREVSYFFLVSHSRSRARVRGVRGGPIVSLFGSPRVAVRKEGPSTCIHA